MATKSDKKSSLKKWTSTTPRVIRMFISGGGYRILLKTFHLHKAFSLPFSLPFLHPVSDPAILSINDKKGSSEQTPMVSISISKGSHIVYTHTHTHTDTNDWNDTSVSKAYVLWDGKGQKQQQQHERSHQNPSSIKGAFFVCQKKKKREANFRINTKTKNQHSIIYTPQSRPEPQSKSPPLPT